MLSTLLFSACLVVSVPPEATSKADLAAYQTAKAAAGRDAEAHVKLALWCEAHGMTAERVKHLAIAVLNDPKQATARGLLGLVDYEGKWRRPDAVSDAVKADDKLNVALAEYNARRARTPETVDAQWKLATWCEQNGLKAEAVAHLTAVTRLDPTHDGAWKRLGYRKVGSRWVTDGQLTAEKAELDAQTKADRTWFKQLVKWKKDLNDPKRRDEAEKGLDGLTDTRAVPAVWVVFAQGNDASQQLAVRLLGRLETGESSQGLAMLTVFSESAETRRQATESLKRRDPRDYLGWMISLIRDELKYEVRPVNGPGSPGILFVQGEQFNLRRSYVPPPLPDIKLFAGEPITYDGDGLPVVSRMLPISTSTTSTTTQQGSYRASYGQLIGNSPINDDAARIVAEAKAQGNYRVGNTVSSGVITESTTTTTTTPEQTTVQIPIGRMLLEYQKAAMASEADLEDDIAAVDLENVMIRENNSRVTQVLRNVTGHDEGVDREAWTAWSTDRQGYVYKPAPKPEKPTVDEAIPSSYIIPTTLLLAQTVPEGPPTTRKVTTAIAATTHACFKAGTNVKTLVGDRAIETLMVGDEVLTQDTTNGSLSYQPVLVVYHNPPSATYKLDLGSESVSATGIHRFWKVGFGWVMARDLKVGDKVRTLNGPVEVLASEVEPATPVFNLEVASGQSYFVGQRGALVHDNSLVRPVVKAFDQEPQLATATSSR